MKHFTTIDPCQIDQKSVHNHLLSAIAPRPICFASTIDKEGNVNLSPFSFFNVFSSNPPILIFSPANRGKDKDIKHTLSNILEVKEVVINIIHYPLVEQMSLSSTSYEKGVDEFVKSGLTPLKSNKIKPPRVKEAPIAFECKVSKIISLGDHPGAGNLVLAEVVLMHFENQYLDKDGNLLPQKIDWVARMGGSWYAKITKEALFQIPKPNYKIGMGVDQLPLTAQKSKVLSGNDLGRLGNIDCKPTPLEIDKLKDLDPIKTILQSSMKKDKIKQLHFLTKKELELKNNEKALAIVFLAEQIFHLE